MRIARAFAASATVALIAAGCAAPLTRELVPGQSSAADVEAVFGPAAESQPLPDGGKLLWFPEPRPDTAYGMTSYAARIDRDGRLVSIEQRINEENIARVQPGRSTRQDVRGLFGPPARSYDSGLKQRHVWEYPLARGTRPGTLFVEFTADDVVSDIFVIEQRAPRTRRSGLGAR